MLLPVPTKRAPLAAKRLRRSAILAGLFALTTLAPLAAQPLALDGVVADEKGKPLAGATVELQPLLSEAEVVRLLVAGRDGLPATASAKTDAAGRYRLAAPQPGMWIVLASAPGKATLQRELVPLLEAASLGEARLPAGVAVRIRVVDPTGKPVAGAFVQAATESRTGWARRWAMRQEGWALPGTRSLTASDGTLTLYRLQDDRLALLVAAPGFPQIKAKEGSSPVEIRLEPGCRRTVAALDGSGNAVPGVVVSIGDSPVGLTGAEGTVEAAFPCKERSTIRWIAPDGRHGAEPVAAPSPSASSPAGMAPASRITLTVRPGFYAGQVLEPSSRKPIAAAFVWAEGDPGAAVRSDEAGRYLIPLPSATAKRLAGASDRTAEAWAELPATPGGSPSGGGKIAGPTLLLRPTATLRGTVVDEEGHAVAGARVQTFLNPAEATGEFAPEWLPAEQRTGEDGAFRFRLTAGAPLTLEASHPRRIRARQQLPALKAGEQKTGIRLELRPGRAAFGRVVDLREKPIAGATVNLMAATGADDEPMWFYRDFDEEGYQATTGADGRFELAKIPSPRLDLQVRASGYAPLLVPGIPLPALPSGSAEPSNAKAAPARPVDLGTVVLRPGATFRGVVVDQSGRPISGASVNWFSQDSDRARLLMMQVRQERSSQLLSGADGRFSISDLANGGSLSLFVAKEGYGEARLMNLTASTDPAEPPLKVTLEPTFTVRGTVLDEAGRPIAEAAVALLTAEAGWMEGGRLFRRPARSQVTTDAEGRFALKATEPGKMRVEAQVRGFRRNGVDFEARELRDVEGIEVILRPGATLGGRVTGPDGEPVQGARLSLSGAPEDSPFRTSDNVAVTNGEGEYNLSGLEEARRDVTVYAAGFLTLEKAVEIHAGVNRSDLRLERALSIEGRVLDPRGRPAAGATVSAMTKNSETGSASGEDGTFIIPGLRPGSYKVSADHSRYGPSEAVPIEVGGSGGPAAGGRPGAPAIRGIELRLTEGGAVRGKVVGLTFEQLPNVAVQASRAEGGEGAEGDLTFVQAREASLDFQGEYRLTGLKPGEWRIAARLRNRSAEGLVTVQAGAEARLDLEFRAGSTLAGRVTRSGEPLPRASVLLQPLAGTSSGYGQTDSRGAFRIEGLDAGAYRLQIAAYGSALRHEQEVDVPAAGEILIDLAGTTLRGRVVDSRSRAPIPRVLVGLGPEEPGGRFGRSAPPLGVETDDAGTFTFSDVSPGRLQLTASKEGYTRMEVQLEVTEEGVDGVAIELQATEGRRVRIATAQGAEMPAMAIVALVDPASGAVQTQTQGRLDETGRAPLDSLPGSWELLVQAPGLATSLQPATFPGPEPVAVLVPSSYLHIRAPSLEGLASGGEVEVRDSSGRLFRSFGFDGRIRSRFAVERGRAGIPNLPAGTWFLTLKAPGGATLTGSATTRPGEQNAVTLGGEGAEAPHP